jgi:hypothetical protein
MSLSCLADAQRFIQSSYEGGITMKLSRTTRTRPLLGLLLTALLAMSSSAYGDTFIHTANSLVFGYLAGGLPYTSTILNTHEGDVTNFNGDLGSPDWIGSSMYRNWESVTMTSPGPTQVSATFKGTQEYDFITPKAQTATIRDFSLTNVSLNPNNVQLRFQAPSGQTSLNLNNATADFGNAPSFYNPVQFNLNATGGASQLNTWQGQVGSSSTINVSPLSSLEFFRSGDVDTSVNNNRLWFTQPSNLANVNGGTLIINESNILFTSDTNTDGFAIRNGGTLEMKGFKSKLETGKITVADSTATLGDNTHVIANVASFQNAAVSLGSGSTFTTDALYAAGASTVKTTQYATNINMVVGAMSLADNATTLNVTGDGIATIQAAVIFNHGTINVKDTANVQFRTNGSTQLAQGRLNVDPGAVVTVEDGHEVIQAASMAYTNNGMLDVVNGTYVARGHSAIEGAGYIELGIDGVLVVDGHGQGSLTTTNTLTLDNLSTTRLTVNPLALSSDLVDVQNDLFIDAHGLANLDLLVEGDTVLKYGTKFTLFDYANTQGSHHFSGLKNGKFFTLGLNNYRILYDDPAYGGHAITLSAETVPEPSTLLLLGSGLGGLIFIRRRSRTA